MSYPSLTHVLPISYPCLTHLLPISYPSLTHVLPKAATQSIPKAVPKATPTNTQSSPQLLPKAVPKHTQSYLREQSRLFLFALVRSRSLSFARFVVCCAASFSHLSGPVTQVLLALLNLQSAYGLSSFMMLKPFPHLGKAALRDDS